MIAGVASYVLLDVLPFVSTIVDAFPNVAPMIRFVFIVISVLLSGCTNTPASSTVVAISATIIGYSAAVEDRNGSFDLLYATVTARASHARKSLKIRLSPGGLPLDSPFRSSGTKVTFAVEPTELSKSEIPYAEIKNLKVWPCRSNCPLAFSEPDLLITNSAKQATQCTIQLPVPSVAAVSPTALCRTPSSTPS